MKQRKKFEKKKERERRVHKKLLRRREIVHQEKKAEAEKENKLEQEYQSSLKPLPTVNDPAKRDEMIKKRLQENMKILEALEKEYTTEIQNRKDLQDKLAEEDQKAFLEKVQEEAEKQGLKFGGEAEVHCKMNDDENIENSVNDI